MCSHLPHYRQAALKQSQSMDQSIRSKRAAK